jgi:hypothetical protein
VAREGTRRYTIDLGEKIDNVLTRLALENETSKAEIIKRAVAVYNFLQREAGENRPDRKVTITDNNDKVLKEICLP